MVTGLSVLTSLKSLNIEVESPLFFPGWDGRRPLPPTRTLLPVLAWLRFSGVSEYLEDLVARIDAPLLDNLEVIFIYQPCDTPQLVQFINRTPKLMTRDEARVVFTNRDVRITLPPIIDGTLRLVILCEDMEVRLSRLVEVCSSSFPRAFITAVERLYILEDRFDLWRDEIENSQWLELLRLFSAVKDLYMSCEITPFIAPALQELVEERVTEVLPALQNFFLEEQPLWSEPSDSDQEAIDQFVAARQLTRHTIAVSRWERERDDSDEWYEIDD
jgi:hypothetical protein